MTAPVPLTPEPRDVERLRAALRRADKQRDDEITALVDRALTAEAKLARVRAALDADERSSVLLAVARAIIDDEPVLDTEAAT